ncbi:hypothetical protein ACLKA6_010869 [Drosophila palustris]
MADSTLSQPLWMHVNAARITISLAPAINQAHRNDRLATPSNSVTFIQLVLAIYLRVRAKRIFINKPMLDQFAEKDRTERKGYWCRYRFESRGGPYSEA